MEITIKATPKEIAALVVALQERQASDDLADKVANEIKALVNRQGEVYRATSGR